MAIMINDSSRYTAAAAGRVLSLAIRAEGLADEIDVLHRDIRAARNEPIRRAVVRCDSAVSWTRQASTELQNTTNHLGRVADAMKAGVSAVSPGACPEHGNTLTSTGGKTSCRLIEYGQTRDYDRTGLPCIEPAPLRQA